MSNLKFDYVPLTFISNQEEIKNQIRNTLILIYLFEKYNSPVRLENLIEGTQYGYNASALQSGNNKFLRISDIHESKVNWDTVPYCNCDDERKYLLKKDDILIARTGGTTGKSFKITNPPAHSIYAGYLIRIRAKKEVNPDYLYLFLHSFAYWSQITNLNERSFRPKANAENLKSLILPDCLTHIQNDAVKISKGELVKGYEELYIKIEKVLEEYDKTQEVKNLLLDQIALLENLNQTILQEAVQGKLVAQNTNDECASELLKRIKAEKTLSGKKDKTLSPIKSEEIPFVIPEGWIWCRLGEICSKIGSGSTPKGSNYAKNGFPFFRSQNIYNDRLVYNDIKFVSHEVQKQMNGTIVLGNDILLNITGGSMGRCALIPKDFTQGNVSQHVCIIRPLQVDRNFYHKVILSPYFQKFIFSSTTGGGREGLPKYNLERFVIPVPPLSEQKRIVAEIEKQFAKTKQLKDHIIANQLATEQLLNALLNQAFEVKETLQVLEDNADLQLQMALIVAQIKRQLGINYGEVALQKTVFNSSVINPVIAKPYSFINSNFGTYSYDLRDDLKTNKYLTKQKIKNKEVYVAKDEFSNFLNEELKKHSNKAFVDGLSQVLKIYELPFINKETDKIELLNTVLKVSLDKKTNKIENIYQGMREWPIDQKNVFKTKADKFSEYDSEIMLKLLIKNKIIND